MLIYIRHYVQGNKQMMLCTEGAGDMFLIVHNIDGIALRSSKVQSVLSLLASVRGLHVIASIDHINTRLRQYTRIQYGPVSTAMDDCRL